MTRHLKREFMLLNHLKECTNHMKNSYLYEKKPALVGRAGGQTVLSTLCCIIQSFPFGGSISTGWVHRPS